MYVLRCMSIPGLAFACGPLSGQQNKPRSREAFQLARQSRAARAINWGIDPFAGGAYSYVNPQTQEAPLAGLASPNGEAIFFCGEALYRGKDAGTVEAALISELETARTARCRASRARSLPAGAGRTASSVCPDLNYERQRGGVGRSCLTQIFRRPTSDSPNFLASFTIGVVQTRS